MIDIFVTKGSNHRFPTKKYGNIDYIQRMYNREIDRVVEYYNLPITEYFRLVDSRAKYVSKQFDISSTINKGELVDVFYNGAPELLLYTEYSHNIFSFKDNWKNYNPVRIITTEDTNLDYRVFNKELNYYGTDFPVFEIDVITMCLMYKYWALERNLLEKSTHPSYFVYNIIFPNMIRQHMNMINFNRMIGTFYNELVTSEGVKHPFMLSGYTKHIDAINNMYLRDVHNKPLKNNSIPGVFIFVATLFTINSPIYSLLPLARPACTYKTAPTTPPTKFPIQTATQILTASNQVTFFSKAPIVIIIALLVNKSPPHINTKLKATPKHAPINIL